MPLLLRTFVKVVGRGLWTHNFLPSLEVTATVAPSIPEQINNSSLEKTLHSFPYFAGDTFKVQSDFGWGIKGPNPADELLIANENGFAIKKRVEIVQIFITSSVLCTNALQLNNL